MTKPNTCTVPGCNRKYVAAGMCDTHARRHRKGGDVFAPIAHRGVTQAYVIWAASQNTELCIPWPYALGPKGYGQASVDGTKINAHRAVCILAHGDAPPGKPHAAHSCRMRHCVNPRHLRWATVSENMIDKRADGTSPEGERQAHAKLSNEQARAIKADARPAAHIARELGVHRSVIERVRRGEAYQNA